MAKTTVTTRRFGSKKKHRSLVSSRLTEHDDLSETAEAINAAHAQPEAAIRRSIQAGHEALEAAGFRFTPEGAIDLGDPETGRTGWSWDYSAELDSADRENTTPLYWKARIAELAAKLLHEIEHGGGPWNVARAALMYEEARAKFYIDHGLSQHYRAGEAGKDGRPKLSDAIVRKRYDAYQDALAGLPKGTPNRSEEAKHIAGESLCCAPSAIKEAITEHRKRFSTD